MKGIHRRRFVHDASISPKTSSTGRGDSPSDFGRPNAAISTLAAYPHLSHLTAIGSEAFGNPAMNSSDSSPPMAPESASTTSARTPHSDRIREKAPLIAA